MDVPKIRQELERVLDRERERGSFAKSADIVKLFRALQAAVSRIEPSLSKEIDKRFKQKLDRLESIERTMTNLVLDAKNLRASEIKRYSQQVQRELALIRNELKELPSIDDVIGFFDRMAENLPKLSPTEIRDSLESIREEEDKLAIEAIKDLRKELDELKKIRSSAAPSGGGITGRDIIKSYDLSPYLDGSTKTFNIPGNWTLLSVAGTSFPFQFRRLVDYTFTPQTLTFTDEINAETSLAEGQTVEVLYVSA